MGGLGTAIAEGMTAFVATNIDDIIILLLFFAQVDATFRPRYVVAGQYLGFTVIILASLPGYLGGLIVPQAWIGMLGLLPIAIGIKQLVSRQEDANAEVQTVNSCFSPPSTRSPSVSFLASILNPQTYKVAAVTVANGGDNIGIYVPLFASSNSVSLGVIITVFFLMVGVWCSMALLLTRQSTIADVLTRYGKAVVPFVLMGLGLYILYESGSFQLLLRLG